MIGTGRLAVSLLHLPDPICSDCPEIERIKATCRIANEAVRPPKQTRMSIHVGERGLRINHLFWKAEDLEICLSAT